MDGYSFTQRVRRTLALAREEAGRLHHEYVGTEHMLLGLIREGEGVAMTVLANLKVDTNLARTRVLETIKTGKSVVAPGPDLPYTSRAKKVLEFAMTEARELGHSYVGTEHLLLGLLREEKGIGGQVLLSVGVTLENARPTLVTFLRTAPQRTPPRSPPPDPDFLYGYVQVAVPTPRANLLLSISAGLAWLMGLLLILNPAGFEASMRIVLDDSSSLIAQAQGAALLGLGFITWSGRRLTDRGALAAILYGNFIVHAVSFAIVLRAIVRGFIPVAGFGPLIMHVLLGAAFVWQLRELKRPQA